MNAPQPTEVEELELMAVVKLTKARRRAVQKLGALVGAIAHGAASDATLAGASVLSSKANGPALRFHLDDMKDDDDPWMLGHFTFHHPEDDERDQMALKLKKKGHTTESIGAAVERVFGAQKLMMQIELHGNAHVPEASPLTGVALVGGVPLEHVGVEYQRRPSADDGPVSLRTRRIRDGRLEFWIRYRIHGVWRADLCQHESKRAREYLRDLLSARP